MIPKITLAKHHAKVITWRAQEWSAPPIVEWVDRDGQTAHTTECIIAEDGKHAAVVLSVDDVETLAEAKVRSACLTDPVTRLRHCIQPVAFQEH